MTPRRTHALLLLSTSALLAGALAGCADNTLAPDASVRRPVVMEPIDKRYCLVDDTNTLDPSERFAVPCIDHAPLLLMPERSAFTDAAGLDAAVDARVDATPDDLAAAEARQGFRSLRAYLDNGESTEAGAAAGTSTEEPTSSEAVAAEKDGVTRDDFALSDGILSLLNDRGEIQVGDSVYKLTRDNVFAVHVSDLELLREKVPTLSSPVPADGDARIASQPVVTTTTEDPESGPLLSRAAAPAGPSFEIIGIHTNNCYAIDGNYRMHGKAYITNAFFYSEAGVKTEWERRKKIFGWTIGWSNTWQAGTLDVGYYSTNLRKGRNYVYPTSGYTYGTGTSGVHIVITHGGFTTIRGTITGTHSSSIGYCESRVSN
ncbi:MAG: hypothetical protein JWM27_4787 [Gemmatimonadetes bacterium]|nr:hypothetical protein [Gemmatimonadota bacterium]